MEKVRNVTIFKYEASLMSPSLALVVELNHQVTEKLGHISI